MEKDKKIPHYANVSILIFAILVAIGSLITLTLYQTLHVGTFVDGINIYAFEIICLVAGYFIAVTLYYVGKMIFGKLAGYRFVSFNFWFLNILRNKEGKLICRLNGLRGLGCKVFMAPNKEKPNYVLYLLGGMIFSLPFFIVPISIAAFLSEFNVAKYYLIFIFGFIPFLIVGNLLPFRYDSNNEGFTLRVIKTENGPEIFHNNLRQYEALVNGRSELKYYNYQEPFTPFALEGLYYNYYYFIDNNEYTRALKTCETLIDNVKDITDSSKVYLGYTGKIYEMCRQKRFDESDRFFWELKHDVRSVVRNKNNFESIKICLYVASYMESNYDDYLNLYYKKDRLAKRYSYLERVDNEVKIIDDTIKSIQEDHKDWFVE